MGMLKPIKIETDKCSFLLFIYFHVGFVIRLWDIWLPMQICLETSLTKSVSLGKDNDESRLIFSMRSNISKVKMAASSVIA